MTFDETMIELQQNQEQIMRMKKELEDRVESYKAKTKALFGICDGETLDIVNLLKAIKVVQKHD